MIGDIWFIFAMALILLRLVFYESIGRIWVVVDILVALFLVVALFYLVFSPIQTQTVNTTVSNVPACDPSGCTTVTEVVNATSTIQTPFIELNSTGFIMLTSVFGMLIIIMFIMAIWDFLRSTNYSAGNR